LESENNRSKEVMKSRREEKRRTPDAPFFVSGFTFLAQTPFGGLTGKVES
jgi:hypothetical protein